MKSSALRAACLLLACLAAGAGRAWCQEDDALAQIHRKGTIEVAVYGEFPPFSAGQSSQDATGIDVDLARAIARQLGVGLRLRLVSAGESASDDLRNHIWKGHYMGGGVADLMLHVGYDPVFAQREKNVLLFAPYFHESVVLACASTRIPRRIAVEGDTISDHIMSSAYGGSLRAAAVRETSLQEAATAFKSGSVDAVMGPKGELQGLFNELGITGISFRPQEAIGQMRTSWDIGLAVKREGGAHLSDAVGKVVATLEADGTLREIFKHYGVDWIAGGEI